MPHKTLKKSLNGQGKVTNGHSTGKKHTMSSNECSCFACTMSLKSENGKSNDVKCLKAFIPVGIHSLLNDPLFVFRDEF